MSRSMLVLFVAVALAMSIRTVKCDTQFDNLIDPHSYHRYECPTNGNEVPICAANGYDTIIFPNECLLHETNIENYLQMPVYKKVNDRFCSHNCPLQCYDSHKPICAWEPLTDKQHTFANLCEMDRDACLSNSEWIFLHDGFCKLYVDSAPKTKRQTLFNIKGRKSIPCPKVFNPVCAQFAGVKSTFINECLVNAENIRTGKYWQIFEKGICAEDYGLREKYVKQKERTKRSKESSTKAMVRATAAATTTTTANKDKDDVFIYGTNEFLAKEFNIKGKTTKIQEVQEEQKKGGILSGEPIITYSNEYDEYIKQLLSEEKYYENTPTPSTSALFKREDKTNYKPGEPIITFTHDYQLDKRSNMNDIDWNASDKDNLSNLITSDKKLIGNSKYQPGEPIITFTNEFLHNDISHQMNNNHMNTNRRNKHNYNSYKVVEQRTLNDIETEQEQWSNEVSTKNAAAATATGDVDVDDAVDLSSCQFDNNTICARYGDQIRTFANVCDLLVRNMIFNQNWLTLHEGDCENCTRLCRKDDYKPLCVSRNDKHLTFVNDCYMNAAICLDKQSSWKVLNKGECENSTGRSGAIYEISQENSTTEKYMDSTTTRTTTENSIRTTTAPTIEKFIMATNGDVSPTTTEMSSNRTSTEKPNSTITSIFDYAATSPTTTSGVLFNTTDDSTTAMQSSTTESLASNIETTTLAIQKNSNDILMHSLTKMKSAIPNMLTYRVKVNVKKLDKTTKSNTNATITKLQPIPKSTEITKLMPITKKPKTKKPYYEPHPASHIMNLIRPKKYSQLVMESVMKKLFGFD